MRAPHPRPVAAAPLRALILALLLSGSALLRGQELTFEPIAFGLRRTGGGTWRAADDPATYAGWGVRGRFVSGPWEIWGEFVNARFFGLSALPNPFSPEQSFSWRQHATGVATEFDTDFANVKLAYNAENVTLFFMKGGQKWGPGVHPLTVSRKPPTYPQFGFNWQVTPNLHFSYFHGDLFSGVRDVLRDSVYVDATGRSRLLPLDRFIAAHRVEWSPRDWLTLGFSESVVYGARGLETIYLLPIVPFWSAQHYLGDTDNIQMSADVSWKPAANWRLYGVFMMDEWRPQDTFKKNNRNWFGWQGGVDGHSILAAEDHLALEVTWTDHRIYRHRFPVNDFYSHGYPVGHWSGPHAQTTLLTYMYPIGRSRLRVSYLAAKRGEVTDSVQQDQYSNVPYTRFSGETESLHTFELSWAREMLTNFWVEAGVSRIRWTNAGFNPRNPGGSKPEEVNKASLTLGFAYNFNLPGYHFTSGEAP